MDWIDEDYIKPHGKRAVGRPPEAPFRSSESEEDFVRCGKMMIDLYYRPKTGSKKDFVFDEEHAVSKTLFWTLIYLYYVHEKEMHANQQGFHDIIVNNFGKAVICDRASFCRSINAQDRLRPYLKHGEEFLSDECKLTPYEINARKESRKKYFNISRFWEG